MYALKPSGIKNILTSEIKEHFDNLFNVMQDCYVPDVQKTILYNAKREYLSKLESCNDYESLADFISWAGYRMSLEEWITSL